MRSHVLLAGLFLIAPGGCADDGHDAGAGDLSDDEISDAFEQAYTDRDLKGDTARCSGVVVPDPGGFRGKIALTFDDGPNPITTPQILQTLRAHDAPATFFINGKRVVDDKTRAIVKEIVDDPLFILANHTWAHPQMTRLSFDKAEQQIDKTTAVIEAAGGEAEWFRFPFGASNCTTAEQVCCRPANPAQLRAPSGLQVTTTWPPMMDGHPMKTSRLPRLYPTPCKNSLFANLREFV